jgi:hypothetical protein
VITALVILAAWCSLAVVTAFTLAALTRRNRDLSGELLLSSRLHLGSRYAAHLPSPTPEPPVSRRRR